MSGSLDYELKHCVRRFFEILDMKETNDDGDKTFHPVEISCCRVMTGVELDALLKRMKEIANS